MTNLYLRKYRLLIGEAVTKVEEYKTVKKITPNPSKYIRVGIGTAAGATSTVIEVPQEPTTTEETQVSQRTEGGKAIEVTELKIEATISKSLSSTGQGGDTTQIKVYNLSPESKKYLQGSNVVVQLYAGYESDPELSLLYSGYVIKQHTTKQGQDKITVLSCMDAFVPKASARSEASFPPGTKTEDAVRAMASGVQGLSVGYVRTEEARQKLLPRGWSWSGPTWDGLVSLCQTNGLLCLVDNGVVNVAPAKVSEGSAAASSYKAKAVVITPALIKGSVEPMDDTSVSNPTEGSKTAIRVNTFLDARLTIDGFMRIQGTEEYDGDYRITSVTHSLDSRGGAWDTTVESERIA